MRYVYGLAQDYSNSSASAIKLLQPWAQPLMRAFHNLLSNRKIGNATHAQFHGHDLKHVIIHMYNIYTQWAVSTKMYRLTRMMHFILMF